MRILHSLCILALCCLFPQTALPQQRDCGTMEYLSQQLKSDPLFRENIEKIERHTAAFRPGISERSGDVITIPVVVHVVYDVLSKNVSEAQIQSQLDVLNKDFRRLNSDRNNNWMQADDPQIEFCLAIFDPDGNPTTGITRTNTLRRNFTTNDDVKKNSAGGKDGWPSDQYLNIWVCDIAGSVLGYAQFPGGPAASDGVVIDYQAFGTMGTAKAPFHLGRTATHEIGHWLNLRHIWGDGDCTMDDFIIDTPTASGPNYKCNTGRITCGNVNMVENYMDYSDDACMNLFTGGQKARMRALFTPGGFRHSLLSSAACKHKIVDPEPEPETVQCSNITIRITFDSYPQETSWQLRDDKGKVILSGSKYTSLMKNKSIQADTCLTAGCYSFVILDSYGDGICCKYGKGLYEIMQDGIPVFSGGSFTKTEEKQICITAPESCKDGIKNGQETDVDCGGSSCPPCSEVTDGNSGGSPVQAVLLSGYYFETGWDGWTGGITDTKWYTGPFAWEGNAALMIADDSGEGSAVTSPPIDIRNFQKIKIDFAFYPYSMEKDEDFWLMYHDGNQWHTLKAYVSETDFINDLFYEASFTFSRAEYNFIQNAKFRFQCDASTNADQVYIDAVRISGIPFGARTGDESDHILSISPVAQRNQNTNNESDVLIYPNPAQNHVKIISSSNIMSLKITDLNGRVLETLSETEKELDLDISLFTEGIYFMQVYTENGLVTKKLIKSR